MKQRLIIFAKTKELSIRALEDACGWAAGTIHKINHGIRSDNLASLAEKFPELNLRWLLLGEGEMLEGKSVEKSELSPESQMLLDEIYAQLKLMREICESNYRTIDRLLNENKKLKEVLGND